MTEKWDLRFLGLAEYVAQWSKDPSTRVGAVIVNDEKIVIGMGYNGFPRGIVDNSNMLSNRELKYKLIVHAEINAILNANGSVKGCTLYTYPLPPCMDCAKLLIQAGLKRVVAPPPPERWLLSCKDAHKFLEEAGVVINIIPITGGTN